MLRPLSQTNVFISDAGEACIGDFGLSHQVVEGITGNYSTAWSNAGNPRWQAPELLAGEHDGALARRTTCSDMFAFGRVILELFTGDVPFAGTLNLINITLLVINGGNPTRPSNAEIILRGFDDQIWSMMEECWQKEASARPTALKIAQRLQVLIDSRPSPEASEQTPPYQSNISRQEEDQEIQIESEADALLSEGREERQGED